MFHVKARTATLVAFILVLLTFLLPLSGCRSGRGAWRRGEGSQGESQGTLQFAGRDRTYIVHQPTGYDGKKSVPLVLVLHGGTMNAERTESMTGMNATADRNGFIAVYPNGTGRLEDRVLTWNVRFGFGYVLRNNVDDVGFIRALIESLRGKYSIDPKRIYATGISNGGMLAYLLGSELSDLLAAIAPVAGAVGGSPEQGSQLVTFPPPAQPVSVIAFHGKRDRMVPYGGGQGSGGFTNAVYVPVSRSVGSWVEWDGCQATPRVVRSTDGNVVEETYPGGNDGTEVELVTINDGGHNWPRGNDYPGGVEPGRETSANDLMWEFFSSHPKK